MKKLPLVSVVIPSLNRAIFLKKAIDSIIHQDYPRVEIVVVDGKSNDSTVSLLKQYGNRVKWISEKDKNLAEAINKGIRRASGEWFITLATDEMLCSGSISSYVETAVINNSDIVIGQPIFIDSNENIIEKANHPCTCSFEDIISLKYKIPLAASFIRMSIMKKNFFSEDYVVCPDFFFWLSVFKKNKFFFLRQHTAKFTIHKGSWSSNVNLATTMLNCRIAILKNFFEYNPQYLHLEKRSYVGAYLDIVELFQSSHPLKSKYYLGESYFYWPLTTWYYRWERQFSRC